MDSRSGPTTTDRILEEAFERQQQILLLAVQEGATLKRKISAAGKAKIDQQYDHITRKEISLGKITRSETINSHRMRKIRKKYELCEEIFAQVERRLSMIATEEENGKKYRQFLLSSITDGLVRLFQQEVAIRCLEKDKKLMTEMIPYCVQAYQEYMREQIGFEYKMDLKVADNMTLEQRTLDPYKHLDKAAQDRQCIGGVILADQTGSITFKATLDSRLNILKDICLPQIRTAIWGKPQNTQELK